MSGLLYSVGAIAVVAGALAIGFGIPVNEFSFGNTLIISGTTAVVGGLIVVGLGVVVARLQQLAEALASRTPIRVSRPHDVAEAAAGPRAAPVSGRIPFPPRTKSEAGFGEPHPEPADMAMDEHATPSSAPTLRNPDEPPASVDEEVSHSPQQSVPAPAAGNFAELPRSAPPFGGNGSGLAASGHDAAFDSSWRSQPPQPPPGQTPQPPTAYFDAMWPAEAARPAKSPASGGAQDESKSEPKFDLPPREPLAAPANRSAGELRTAAILKSGVVDGMGYTLYVDGSIEAELPQGTLRFASIDELRSHLEKNT